MRLVGAGSGSSGYAPLHTGRRDRLPINALGYRDLDRAQPKPAGVRRVVCVGDSFTWGVGVLFDDAWPQRIERTLSRTRGERWEAVNLAEPGMNAVEEASRLESEGFQYGPDVVVMGYVLNDSEDSDAAEARRAEDWAEEQHRERGALERLFDRSALVSLVRTRVSATLENRRRITGYRSMYADAYKGWTAAKGALSAMGGMCRAHGVPLVVVIFPLFANPLDARYPFAELHAKVAQAAEQAGAKVLDLLPRYRERRLAAAGRRRDGRRAPERDRPPHRGPGDRAHRRRGGPAPARPRASMSGAGARRARRGRRGAPGGTQHPRDAGKLGHLRRRRAPAGRLHAPRARRSPAQPGAAAAREAACGRTAPGARARAADGATSPGARPASGSSAAASSTAGTTPTACCSSGGFRSWRSPRASWSPCSSWPGAASGRGAAIAACCCAALSPDVLAHGSLVTTDLAFALFFFLAVLAVERLLERATPGRSRRRRPRDGRGLRHEVLGARSCSACSRSWALRAVLARRPAGSEPAARARTVAATSAADRRCGGGLCAGLARGVGELRLPREAVAGSRGARRAARAAAAARRAASLATSSRGPAARAVVPEDYARGLLFVTEHSAARPTFLLGERRDSRLPVLLRGDVPAEDADAAAPARGASRSRGSPRLPRRDAVAALAAGRRLRGRDRDARPADRPPPPAADLSLPVPRGGRGGGRALGLARAEGAWLAGALGLWYAGGTLLQHPHHLAYFNELAGGPANGWRLLVDSNLDWGQDLKRLGEWTRANHVGKLKLSYFGSADPGYYGIESEALARLHARRTRPASRARSSLATRSR